MVGFPVQCFREPSDAHRAVVHVAGLRPGAGVTFRRNACCLFILVAALYGLMGFLDYARGRVLARFGARFQSKLDDRVFDAVLQRALLPKERGAPASGLRDLEMVQTLFTSPVMLALFDMPWTPFFIAAIFIFHPMLGWLAVFGGVSLIVITLLERLPDPAQDTGSANGLRSGQCLCRTGAPVRRGCSVAGHGCLGVHPLALHARQGAR